MAGLADLLQEFLVGFRVRAGAGGRRVAIQEVPEVLVLAEVVEVTVREFVGQVGMDPGRVCLGRPGGR
ncbi:hypothetical protein SSP35_05_01010 [Streptomyces sp. NBRC 110611]|nr:hypothetical protein SSP35_05_01010 [Streptomyces sp. NBRC 110611]